MRSEEYLGRTFPLQSQEGSARGDPAADDSARRAARHRAGADHERVCTQPAADGIECREDLLTRVGVSVLMFAQP